MRLDSAKSKTLIRPHHRVSLASVQNGAVPSSVRLNTGKDCELGISIFPNFSYNAAGGGGTGKVTGVSKDGREVHFSFDQSSIAIPPLDFNSTRFLGIPLPPPLRIDIITKSLAGTADMQSGKVELDFDAEFCFSAGPLYKAAPLSVITRLTTESSQGTMRGGVGERRVASGAREGTCKLVGVATVPKVDDFVLNTFLQLPTEALAVLAASIEFS
eukprot:jgi/Mesvir1/24380/Mv11049-RA.1